MLNLENPNFDRKEEEAGERVESRASLVNTNSDDGNNNNNDNTQSVAVTLCDESKRNEHCHPIRDEKMRNKVVWRKLITVLILCIFFMVAEIVGGVIASSIAIQTDAAHMAADIAGFFFSIMAIYVSSKAPTKRMSFGYYRSEVLGALLSTLVIWILTGILIYLAVLRIIEDDYEIEGDAMVITASCGVGFNIVMYFVLHTNKCFGSDVALKHHGHSHSNGAHGHSHGNSINDDQDHEDSHGHSHEDSHGHSHGDSHDHSHGDSHGHSHGEAQPENVEKPKRKNTGKFTNFLNENFFSVRQNAVWTSPV